MQVVRTRLRPMRHSRRTLDERLALRFPALTAALARAVSVLPPSSGLRRSSLSRTACLGMAAYNRRDLAAAVAGCDPDFEYRPEPAWVQAGLVEPSYRGLASYRTYVATVDEVWGGENYLTPFELIDAGDRMLLLAEGEMRAQASGVPLAESFALLTTLRHGRPCVMQEYYDHARALEGLGVSPGAARAGDGQ